MRQLGLSNAEVGRRMGVSGEIVRRYRGGAIPSADKVAALAEALQMSQSELLVESSGRDMPERSLEIIRIPTAPYGHAASFHLTADNTDGPDRTTDFHVETLRAMLGGGELPRDSEGNVNLLLSFAVGDSMAPFIPDGHPFICMVGGGFIDGARYALWLGSTQADVIKRVEVRGSGVVLLKSDNPAVATKVLRTGDEPGIWLDEEGGIYDLEIRGRVVWPLDTPAAVVGLITDRLADLTKRAFN